MAAFSLLAAAELSEASSLVGVALPESSVLEGTKELEAVMAVVLRTVAVCVSIILSWIVCVRVTVDVVVEVVSVSLDWARARSGRASMLKKEVVFIVSLKS
jgi:hypothetical protein